MANAVSHASAKPSFVEGSETALAMDDLDKADELLDIVRAWRPGEITPYVRAQRQRFEARLSAIRGQDPTEGFQGAIRDFRDMAMPFWTSVASLELAEWLLGEGRDAEAAPLAVDARKAFEQLRATPWLERLDASGALDALAQAT